MSIEKTLIIIKPDALSKKVAGKIISELESIDIKPLAAKLICLNNEEAQEFYSEHRGKEFYNPLIKFMTSNPVMVMVWEGVDAITRVRKLLGATNPVEADEGTIRRKWAQDGRHNIIHGSDSIQSAKREIEFFFPNEKDIYYWEEKIYKI